MSINSSQKIVQSQLFYATIIALLALLFLHLYKQSLIVDIQYKIQTARTEKQSLEKEIQDLKKEIIQLKSHKNIIKQAKKLGLKKINIKQIERI